MAASSATGSSSGVFSIYIASPEGETGKSTIALGVLHRLSMTVAKVGVFRPITRLGENHDYILELLLAFTTAGLPYESCTGVSYQQLHEDEDAAIAQIVDRYHDVAKQCDDDQARPACSHALELERLERVFEYMPDDQGSVSLPPIGRTNRNDQSWNAKYTDQARDA